VLRVIERSYTPLCFVSLSGVDLRLSVHGCVWVCVGALYQRAELISVVFIVVEQSCVIVPDRRHADQVHWVPLQGRYDFEGGDPCIRGHQQSFFSESGGNLRCAWCH
jgi:hypothetical protein